VKLRGDSKRCGEKENDEKESEVIGRFGNI
jgi:hypothetical protein